MKLLGIIGGIGPESTIDYYRSILTAYAERNGRASAPHLIINSIDFEKVVGLVTANQLDALTGYFVTEVRRLATSGADVGLIAANTPHIVFDEVQRESPIPLISIVRATCNAAKSLNLKRLALLGTRFTMQGRFYSDVFSPESIQLVVPGQDDQLYIHAKYMGELVKGILLPETHAGLLEIVDNLRAEQNIDGVILAGTELPLIIRESSHNGLPLLDTTQIHVHAAAEELCS